VPISPENATQYFLIKFMSSKALHQKNKNGVFYTPNPIADLLVSNIVKKRNISIIDPACGKGNLLTAALRVCKQLSDKRGPHLVGCDRFQQRNLDQCIRFVKSDFFKFKCREKFDLVLTNPPYIQSGRIPPSVRTRYYKRLAQSLGFSGKLDLWVYFLIKSTSHLKKGGGMAAVLPWSFLEAEYAQKVRRWLAANFANIRVLMLRGAHFDDTVKRVLLVWLEGYGGHTQKVQLASSDNCSAKLSFRNISIETWNAENVMAGITPVLGHITERLEEAGFKELKEYADISIGVVTGANKYFILSEEEAKESGFSQSSVLPILTSVEDMSMVANGESPDKKLLLFKKMTKKREKYISSGVKSGFDERSHCQRRIKIRGMWYDVDPGAVPHAFFTYRVSTVPYLVLNPDGYQCTNSLHKVIFKEISKTQRKWIQLSLLSFFGQLMLENGARHYGNCIMKVEPKTLKKALVYTGTSKIPQKIYNRIIQHIAEGRKDRACKEATKLIVDEANIDDNTVNDVELLVKKIRMRRGIHY